MESSEYPPATKRHKRRHKWGTPGPSQKGKSPRAKGLWHAGRQASGEGGIRSSRPPQSLKTPAVTAEGHEPHRVRTFGTVPVAPRRLRLFGIGPSTLSAH